MTRRDENRFRLRPRPPKSRNAGFINRVLAEVDRAGTGVARGGSRRPGARSGRGHTAARLLSGAQRHDMRRVAVKVLLVRLRTVSPRSIEMHLRYICRDSARPRGYGPATNEADLNAFEARSRDDRHQFRFVVAPEAADRLRDLPGYTRELMARMEGDLGTRLDWVAVDHWDTENPHTHVVLRGTDETGQDLVIAGSYIAHGIRQRASEIATHWLGPRTELEMRQSVQREVSQDRWTSLDARLGRLAEEGVVHIRNLPESERLLLLGRLQKLERMELARAVGDGEFRLRHDLEPVLRALGERGDIIRTLQRAMGEHKRELAIFDAARDEHEVTGRIVARGLTDELSDRAYLAIDATDGRAHYVALPSGADLEQFPVGGIVRVRGTRDRAVDQTIAAVARDGIYRADVHRAQLLTHPGEGQGAADTLTAHARRLESLRRAGHVERISDGVWRIPADLVRRGREHDAQRLGESVVELQAHLPLDQQTRAIGATWLDRQLIDGGRDLADEGFGGAVRKALQLRIDFLAAQGLVQRRENRVLLVRDLLAKLRERDVTTAARSIAAETGLQHRPLGENVRVSGVYRRSVLLASGRFALLDNGTGFSLVPWRPVIESRLGRTLSAVVRAGKVSWDLGRKRGLDVG
jgi:type IV secretory pathway VirD2 relaxase